MKGELITIVTALVAQHEDNPNLQAILRQLRDIEDDQNVTNNEIQSVIATASATTLTALQAAQVQLNGLKLKAAPLKKIANDLLKNYNNLATLDQKRTLSQICDSLKNVGTQLDSVNVKIQGEQVKLLLAIDEKVQSLKTSPCNKFMNISGYVIGVLGFIVGIIGTVYGAVAYHEESGSC